MYVLDQTEQERILDSCEPVSEWSQDWTREYKEKDSEKVWVQYYPHSEMQGGGPFYLKQKESESDFLSLADQHLSSSREEDWTGVVTDLFLTVEEVERLVGFLEERKERYSRGAIEVLHSRIRLKRGSMIGKRVTEISEEYERIVALMNRIKNLQQVAAGNGR